MLHTCQYNDSAPTPGLCCACRSLIWWSCSGWCTSRICTLSGCPTTPAQSCHITGLRLAAHAHCVRGPWLEGCCYARLLGSRLCVLALLMCCTSDTLCALLPHLRCALMRTSPAPGELSVSLERLGLLTWPSDPACTLCTRVSSCWEGGELRHDMRTGFCFTTGGVLATRAEEVGQCGCHTPGAQQQRAAAEQVISSALWSRSLQPGTGRTTAIASSKGKWSPAGNSWRWADRCRELTCCT